MKKKGFTLIELLAVIVILAIIALIATPVTLNVIEKAEKYAASISTQNYVKGVRTYIVMHQLDTGVLPAGTYNVDMETIANGKEYKPLNELVQVHNLIVAIVVICL